MLEDMFITDEERITVDLHNMEKEEARYYLERAIDTASENIKEIVVIHGYRRGQVILNMVRKEFKHSRVERKVIPFNRGMTLLLLKKCSTQKRTNAIMWHTSAV